MGKEMKRMGIVLAVLFAGYLINSSQQGQYNSKSDRIFNIDKADVFSIEISKENEAISLTYNGEDWSIVDHDSLAVKVNTVNSFFSTMLSLEKTSLVSKNPANWKKFMVDDSSGSKLRFLDYENNVLSKVIIGRSNAEWSSSNIRIGDEPEVYHTNENVSWQINPSPMHWGEIAKDDSVTTEIED